MQTPITATYHAKMTIAYTKEYSARRYRDLDKLIREALKPFRLDEEKTRWYGHSKAVEVYVSGADRWQITDAVAALEDRLARCSFAQIADEPG